MKLNVIKQRSFWWTLSTVIILAGLISMVISTATLGSPLRLGLDFVGGTRLQYELDCSKPGNCDKPIDIKVIREVMNAEGLGDSSIQILDKQGNKQPGVTIRTKSLNVEQRTKLQNTLSEKIGAFDPKSVQNDTVGPTLGQRLFTSGLLAIIISFAGILIYLSFRFQFDYGLCAFIALFHDVLITAGIFSILGLVQGVEIDSLFVVAILTIIGFSVNDTVVIYDRVREVIKQHPGMHIDQVVEDAVNQTLARSINTTLTVLLTLFSIFLFGGETLKNFALCLIIGFTAGAYSSIFIATTLLAWWRERTDKSQSPPSTGDVEASDTV